MRDPMPQPKDYADAMSYDGIRLVEEESIFSWNKWDTRDCVMQVVCSMLGSAFGVTIAAYMTGLL